MRKEESGLIKYFDRTAKEKVAIAVWRRNLSEFDNIVIFADNGASGINSDRKEFQKLLNLIKSDKVSNLIVKDISRLGRNHVEIGNLIDVILPNHNVRLISVDGSIDSEKGTDEFFAATKNNKQQVVRGK